MVKLMAGIVALAIASSAIASETQNDSTKIPSLKSGECSITLLDSDGIKPLAGAKLTLQSANDAKETASIEANKAGLCVINIKEGRYILSVNDKILTLLDASKNGQLAWCRIVVSEKPMLIGGQEPVTTGAGFTFLGLQGGAAVGAAAGAGILGAGAVAVGGDEVQLWDIDGIDDGRDKDDEEEPPAEEPQTSRPPSASR